MKLLRGGPRALALAALMGGFGARPALAAPSTSAPVVVSDGATQVEGYFLRPRIGSDGQHSCVAWLDEGTYTIRARVIDADGTMLGAKELVLSGPNTEVGAGYFSFMQVAFDGTNFRVFWIADQGQEQHLYQASVSPDGTTSQGGDAVEGVTELDTPLYDLAADCAPDGSCIVLATSNADSEIQPGNAIYKMYVVALDGAGALQGPAQLVDLTCRGFSLAYRGSDFILACPQEKGINLYQIKEGGALSDLVTVALPTFKGPAASLAWNGKTLALGAANYDDGLYVQLLDAATLAPIAKAQRLPGVPLASCCESYTLVASGDQYLAAYSIGQFDGAGGTLIDGNGNPGAQVSLDDLHFGASSGEQPLWAASGPEGTFRLAYLRHSTVRYPGDDFDTSLDRVELAPVSKAGEVGKEVAISTTPTEPRYLTAAGGQGRYLVAWDDARQGIANERIYGTFVGEDGQPIPPLARPLGGDTGAHYRPRLAWNGSHYLVTSMVSALDYSDIEVALVDAEGAATKPPFLLAQGGNYIFNENPAAASNGDGFLVAWVDRSHNDTRVYAARLDAQGQSLDGTGFEVAFANKAVNATTDVTAAWVGGHYLVSWSAGYFEDDGLHFHEITTDGKVGPEKLALPNDMSHNPRNRLVCRDPGCLVDFGYREGGLLANDGSLISPLNVPQKIDEFEPFFDGRTYGVVTVGYKAPLLVSWFDAGTGEIVPTSADLTLEATPALTSPGVGVASNQTDGQSLVAYSLDGRTLNARILTNDLTSTPGLPASPSGGAGGTSGAGGGSGEGGAGGDSGEGGMGGDSGEGGAGGDQAGGAAGSGNAAGQGGSSQAGSSQAGGGTGGAGGAGEGGSAGGSAQAGASGQGGASGTTGSAGKGTAGQAGASGNGGSTAGSGAAGQATGMSGAGDSATSDSSTSDSGCGCVQAPGRPEGSSSPVLIALGLGLALARSRGRRED